MNLGSRRGAVAIGFASFGVGGGATPGVDRRQALTAAILADSCSRMGAMRTRRWLLAGVLVGLGCMGSPSAGPAPQQSARGSKPGAKPAETNDGRSANRPVFVRADAAGPAETIVQRAQDAAATEGARVLVYVGATWCEPCRRFHEAVESGALDERLAGVRFLEFDADVDTERLNAAGYGGRMIPRFAVPGPGGRGHGLAIEGGTKGDGAVEHIMARLEPLLQRTSRG